MASLRVLLVLLVLVISITSCASAIVDESIQPSGEVITYGIYAYSKDDGRTWINPLSTSPGIWEDGFAVLIKKTDRIPLLKDIYFAFDYTIRGFHDGKVQLDWTVTHPVIIKPNGSQSSGYSYVREFVIKDGKTSGTSGYILNQDYELVPGQWTFSYSYQGTELVRKSFTVFRQVDG